MQIFASGDPTEIISAVSAIDAFHNAALDPDNGEFLLQLVGVVDDPLVA
jgi:DNA-binding phage protein